MKQLQIRKGEKYGRIENSEEPNGYLEETAFINSAKQTEQFSIEENAKQLKKAQKIYFQNGITTVQDGLTKKGEFELLKYAAKNQMLDLDVISYIEMMNNKQILQENPEYVKQYQNRLKIGGYKIVLDGSPQGKTAWLSKPYEGEKEYRGYPTHTNQEVERFVAEALKEDVQLLAHCNGDQASEQLIEAFEKEEKQFSNDIRPVMIHSQTVMHKQLEHMKKIKMIPSFFIAHIYYWGDIHIKNLGQRAYHISPAKYARDHGLIYTFHQDTPVIMPNMLETIWCAVNRITKQGVVLGEDEKLDVYDSLKAVTIYSAYQYFEENEKGSIKEGKLADLIILDKNPLKIEKSKINQIKVLQTIKEGKVVFTIQEK